MGEDYGFLNDLVSFSNQKKSITMRPEDDVVELLWQNGNVVMNSQANRQISPPVSEPNHTRAPCNDLPKTQRGEYVKNPNNSAQEDETTHLFQHLLAEPLGRDFCSEFFNSMLPNEDTNKPSFNTMEGGRHAEFENNRTLTPPVLNFAEFPRSNKRNTRSNGGFVGEKEVGDNSSTMTQVSSNLRSNSVHNQANVDNTLLRSGLLDEVTKQVGKSLSCSRDIFTTTATSSSGGSGSSIGRTQQTTSDLKGYKRKVRDSEEPECQSEDVEPQSGNTRKLPQKFASIRRSRSAEVHNLSERRRRDRINEKMKALQELVPHCNKTDKASMLDEAIEYLKSLQLQVQMMWMGNGMSTMMFPNVQHYLSSLNMGIAHSAVPSLPAATLQMPRIPQLNTQPMASANIPNQAVMSMHTNQTQNPNISDAYLRFLDPSHTCLPSQVTNYSTAIEPQTRTTLVFNSNHTTERTLPPKNGKLGP